MTLDQVLPQPGGSRFLLKLSDGGSLCCGAQELLDLGLRSGLSLDSEAEAALREACAAYVVRCKAAELLSRRPMSAGELRQKLLEKGAHPAHGERAVARLVELGLLDEAAYAEQVVRRCAAKGYGRRRAEQELYRHKLPRNLWDEALSALPEAESKLDALIAAKLSSRSDGQPPDEGELRRLSAHLQRRGYDWSEIREALRRYTAD